MFKIETLNPIAKAGLDQLSKHRYQVTTASLQPDAILVRSHQMHDQPIPASVKVIGRAGAGTNNIPVEQLTKRGIPVLNTPGANANAVCELVLSGLLLASRHLSSALNYVNSLTLTDDLLHQHIEQHKKQFVGTELAGKKLGVVGLGQIGVKVANAAVHLGMEVVGYDPNIAVENAWALSSNVHHTSNLKTLFSDLDFVSLHIPLNTNTKYLINAQLFNLIQKPLVLLNFSREKIVHISDLLKALEDNKIKTYVNDFPTTILLRHPAVISLPHLGASTVEAEENCACMIVNQVKAFLEHGVITHSVNFPIMTVPPLRDGVRLAVVNENIPNMVAQISACLADAKLNIISLSNQSRDQIAYTLIDLASIPSQTVIDAINHIQGVINLRVICSESIMKMLSQPAEVVN